MLDNHHGKLLVYASNLKLSGKRLQSVSGAAERIADLLKLPMEVVTFGEDFSPIYVYYKNGEDDPIPIYCNKSGKCETQAIYKTLRDMIFVLSFHPKHSALKAIRKEVIQFS